LHSPLQAGTTVEVRGRRWILLATVPRADCTELHLSPAAWSSAAAAPGGIVLLEPFDRPTACHRSARLRVVSRRAWMAAFRAAWLGRREPGGLAGAARADADLLPHQLEPALAIVRHGARRVLLADAVGLGKTIEAGFVLAELRERAMLDRALVLAPPGLCDQWCAELSARFGLDASVADAAWLRSLRPLLPPGANPWSTPGVHVASLDFVKRPEVRRGMEHLGWDAVIVDEAHLAAGDSERRAAAHVYASHAKVVLLLTATPHSGDARTFLSLCRIGALNQQDLLVMFRRTREQAGIAGRRRVHLRRIEPAAAERAVREGLDQYVRAVWARRTGTEGHDARLAMTVLLKRSLSGMASLRRSLAARIERLGQPAGAALSQLPLPWAEEDEADAAPQAVLAAPGLDDEREERSVLSALLDRAALAGPHDSKLRALERVLARIHEPVIVFTEFRDTLESLRAVTGCGAAILHGGMDRFERADAIHAFTSGRARVLLATDAAGEGLNLQQGCRLVVNLELPWNPMRLEQRIGRVDRIGQTRTVHVINLLAAGTAEAGILARLARRLEHARRSVGAMADVLGPSDDRVVAAWLDAERAGADTLAGAVPAQDAPLPRTVCRPDLRAAGVEAAAQLERQRDLMRAGRLLARARNGGARSATRSGVLAACVRRSTWGAFGGREGLLVIFRRRWPASWGRATSDDLVPVFAEGRWPAMRRLEDVRAWAASAMTTAVPRMAALIPPHPAVGRTPDYTSERDARLAARMTDRRAIQRGLFDRRAERDADAEELDVAPDAAALVATVPPPEPLLLLFIAS
jgi:hypothetical protein